MRRIILSSIFISALFGFILVRLAYWAHPVHKPALFDDGYVRILTPDPKKALPGQRTSAQSTTYTSPDGGYSVTYPKDWTTDTNTQLPNYNGEIPVFTTGPVGNKILGYPSFLQIAVDDNPRHLTLAAFVARHFTNALVQNITIGQYSALWFSDAAGPVPGIVYLFSPEQRIYQIRTYQGAAPKISSAQLTDVLKSFTIK